MKDSQQHESATKGIDNESTLEMSDRAEGEEKIQKDTTDASPRSSGRSRQSGGRSHYRSSRSGRSPHSRSHRHREDQTTPNSGSSKRRRERSPKSLPRNPTSALNKPSSQGSDIRLPFDSPNASVKKRPGTQESPRKGEAVIQVPFDSPTGSVKKKRTEVPRSPRNPKSPHIRREKRRQNGDKLKSSVPSKPSRSTDPVTNGAFMAETVDEQSETNRERMRDLEVQSADIQQRMQNQAMAKSKKGKLGDTVDQDTASNGGKRITICKVLAVAAVYLAGVGTGFLISELRQRNAQKIYVTQSPTAVVVPTHDPTTASTEFSYSEPTNEDCFAIESKEEEVNGQDGMITRSYDVHFDVQLNDSSTDWYGQLEETMTDDVVPDLACCRAAPSEERQLITESTPMEFSTRGHYHRMLRNIRCVVANGSTRGDNNDNGESCVELTGLCIPAVVTLDLTLKGDEADGDIMDLVRNVIQGDGSEPLVEKFDLERNVFSVVKLVDVVDHLPRTQEPVAPSPTTSRPTLSPTVTSAPVSGPTTNSPTRVVTQPPTARPATPTPTSGGTESPTTRPAPGDTPRPTPAPSTQPTTDPTLQPSSKPSRGPTESPSTLPTLVPTILDSLAPSSSPTTSAPSLTPSAAPTGRRQVLQGILVPVVGTIDTSALDWLADTDTWSPPATEADPNSMWVERYAMARFYLATNGASWTNQLEWMTSTSVCDWAPDTCNGNNRIRSIDVSRNGLSGTIPTEVGLFPNLDVFEINNNGIRGTIPTEIALSTLRHLRIDSNDISGSMPSELGMIGLTNLNLSKNNLEASIPQEVLSLSSLRVFHIESNRLTGTIGSELGAMREVVYLNVQRNQFSGSLPSELGLLTKLTYMTMQFGPFTGSIPSELGLATMLQTLLLGDDDISGAIPTTLAQLTMLTTLNLDRSNLSGPVPTELGRLTALTALDLDNTNLSGTIPSELNLLTNLRHFEIDNTEVFGSIPDLSALVNLETVSLDNCQLAGSFPPGMFNNMLQLEEINFSKNSLTGAIPAIPNPSLLRTCLYGHNCFSDLTNAGTCDLTNNCV